MKQFKTESKRVLDLMINSIYTHKEIFLRELLSNASDAIDKLYYKSLTGGISGLSRDDFSIEISADKEKRTLTVTDNGIGMTEQELDSNLGVIAKSGSLDFKKDINATEDINIIGQFGVGFYSSFMVSDKVEVISRAYGADKAYKWTSTGASGYEITESELPVNGTKVIMYLKANDKDGDSYDQYLEEYTLKEVVKKYSDYIHYPIRMLTTHYKENEETKKSESYTEMETLNTMIPLWKKNKKDIKPEEYNEFYKNMSYDDEAPLRVIHTQAEGGLMEYKALLFIPATAPLNYYSKTYEKGLRLYTNGVMIMDRCEQLLPDYFSFVKGLVDSELTLNISRETIQHNRQLMAIKTNVEKKIKSELLDMQTNDRDNYVKFFKEFGVQIKYGVYDQWGANKEFLRDLLLYYSIKQDKYITLSEYVTAMQTEQKYIYYATGKTIDYVKALPQCEKVLDVGYDILCMTDDVDEFAVKILMNQQDKEFRNVAGSDLGLPDSFEVVDEDKEFVEYLKTCLGDKVVKVKPSHLLKSHPVCLTSEGEVSIDMEKVLNSVPGAKNAIHADKVLEINASHPVYAKMKGLYDTDKDKLSKLINVLYNQALLIEGLPIVNPTELTNSICDLI